MKPNRNLETTVGIFLLLGIGVICTLILFFGEVKDIFKPTYTLNVTFANASGLLKGSDVFLSGAHVGKVTTDPEPIPDTQDVKVQLKIDSRVKIREDARYVIGSSGLLGDLYVDVKPVQYPADTPEDKKSPYVKNNAEVTGSKNTDLNELADSAKPLIEKANDIASHLDHMIKQLDVDVLSGTSTDDLKETISKLRDMVSNGDLMVKNANDLITQAKTGKGPVGRLINDKKLGNDLAAFISNLKAHGPIFYSDDSADKDKDDDAPKKKNK